MEINKILHTLSNFNWVFLVAIIVLILYSFIVLPGNLISMTGILLYLSGIHIGLESLSSVEIMSVQDQNRYNNRSYLVSQSRLIFIGIIMLIVIGAVFISLNFIFSSTNNLLFNDLFNLGLNCRALILGLLCLLKNVHDKYAYANSSKN